MRSTIATLFLAGSVSAQPVVQSGQMLAPGETTYMRLFDNFSPVDTSMQGADITWDFTALQPTSSGSEFIITIVDPATTPHANLFATDNYAYLEQPAGYYRFFQKTETFMQRVGSWTGWSYSMADPQVEYVFPLTMGTSSSDTWWGVSDGGTYDFECVGYGTLLLPGAQLENCLMVRVRLENTFYTYFGHFWYSGTDGRILLQSFNNPAQGLVSGVYYDGYAMAVHEQRPLQLTMLGNPVQNAVELVPGERSGRLQYTLTAMSGAMLGSGSFAGDPGHVQRVDVSHLSAGIYLLHVTDGGQRPTALRFVKQ